MAVDKDAVLAELLQALEWIANTNGGTTTDRNLAMKRIARDALAKAKQDLVNS